MPIQPFHVKPHSSFNHSDTFTHPGISLRLLDSSASSKLRPLTAPYTLLTRHSLPPARHASSTRTTDVVHDVGRCHPHFKRLAHYISPGSWSDYKRETWLCIPPNETKPQKADTSKCPGRLKRPCVTNSPSPMLVRASRARSCRPARYGGCLIR
jgi:hypothetical protein